MKNSHLKPITLGLSGTVSLLMFYFLIMRTLSGSWETTFSQFRNLWYFMLPLSLGFGIQVGLYTNLKQKTKNHTPKTMMAGTTTTSSLAMIACCAHHLTDVLPLLGLSFFSSLLATYQIPILVLAIISNLLGILHLLKIHSQI